MSKYMLTYPDEENMFKRHLGVDSTMALCWAGDKMSHEWTDDE